MTLIVKVSKYEDVELPQVSQKKDCGSPFDNIPDDVFFKICSYLLLQDVWKLGSVCKKWYRLTRNEVLWNRTDIPSLNLTRKQSQKLLKNLPPCVRELRIGGLTWASKHMFPVPTVFELLLDRYPQLSTLIIQYSILAKPYEKFHFKSGFMLNCTVPWKEQVRRHYSVVKYHSKVMEANFNTFVCLLHKITVLSFRSSILAVEDIFPFGNVHIVPPMVKILDLTYSPCAIDGTIDSFSRLPFLEELYLAGTPITINGVYIVLKEVHKLKVLDLDDTVVGNETFEALRKHGQSLVEIYLGRTALTDSCMIDVDEGDFPALRKLCLVRTNVSEIGVKKLLLAVPSLACILITKSRVKITWALDQPRSVRVKLKYDDCDEGDACDHFLTNIFQGAF